MRYGILENKAHSVQAAYETKIHKLQKEIQLRDQAAVVAMDPARTGSRAKLRKELFTEYDKVVAGAPRGRWAIDHRRGAGGAGEVGRAAVAVATSAAARGWHTHRRRRRRRWHDDGQRRQVAPKRRFVDFSTSIL